LGEGGMGSVFRARRLFIDDFVAIKFVRPEVLANPEFRERFYQEARVAARLKHPNVVTVYDFGETPDGMLYLVMEFLKGVSLGELLQKKGALPVGRVIEIGLQIGEALHCMHENNVIHRDLKPDNIMLIRDGKEMEIVKVVDFGVAKIIESNPRLTRYQARIGSPVYCSPEQYLGLAVDHRTDLYGLGIIFYECLSGHVPFEALDETELRAAILHKMPPRLDTKIKEMSGHMADLVQWLLAKDPNDRPYNAATVNKCLHALRRSKNSAFEKNEIILNPSPQARPVRQSLDERQKSKPKKRRLRRPGLVLALVILLSLFTWKAPRFSTPSNVPWEKLREFASSLEKLVMGEKTSREKRPLLATNKLLPATSRSAPPTQVATANASVQPPPATGAKENSAAKLDSRSASNSPPAKNESRTAPTNTNQKIETRRASELRESRRKNNSLAERRLSATADSKSENKSMAPKTAPAIPAGMVLIKGAEFKRGDLFGDGNPNEKPVHLVRVEDFLIGQHEVTNREYLEFVRATKGNLPEWMNPNSDYHYQTGSDPFYKKLGAALYSLDHPVIGVSWSDAITYCAWLSLQGSYKFRLPTEAEWELAARGGNAIKYSWGNGAPSLALGGNVGDEALKKVFPDWPIIWRAYNDNYAFTAPVKKFGGNALGIFDMTGNVAEWCSDWYQENYYQKQNWDRPAGPPQGIAKVIRGGSWGDTPAKLRIAYRRYAPPSFRSNNLGFRVTASVP
jgi:formylglycine-generating enzyme required for sulfatase activity/predicted Ser/Thr protein kinase